MIGVIVAVLILCFIIGIISSALFVASFYLYRESRRSTTAQQGGNKETAEAATAPKASVPSTAATVAGDAAAARKQQPEAQAARGSLQELKSIVDSRNPAKRRNDPVGVHCGSVNNVSSECASCSYTCEVCGSCCPSGKNRSDGKGDQCQQLPPYPCGEFFVSGVDVGFKCLQAGTCGGGSGNGDPGGTFFFYRGRLPVKLLDPICPSDRYVTMAALPSVPYHMWFCPGQHTSRSPHCPDCRQVLSFELCDSEIQFQHRDAKRWVRGVWLLACQEVSGKNSVIYRGDVGSLASLHYAGKLIVYFGLSDIMAAVAGTPRRTRMAADGAAESGDEDLTGDTKMQERCGVDGPSSPSGGLKSLHPRRLPVGQMRQWLSYGRNDCGNNDHCDSDCEVDTITSDTDSQKHPSPMSLGSNRKAVKWPITQIENLMESSSSDERQTDVGVPLADLPSDLDRDDELLQGSGLGNDGNNTN